MAEDKKADEAKTSKSADSDDSVDPAAAATSAQPLPTEAEVGEGATTEVGGATDTREERRAEQLEADNQHIEVIADPEGQVSNRVEGTIQREATPEELPPDAKIAPVAEQVNPNAAAQAVGALETPTEIAGVKQPGEGEKNLKSDMSDPTDLLPPKSKQVEDAERAAEDAERDADRGRV